MTAYTADMRWALKENEDFRAGRYSRGYAMRFDGGAEVPGSASPHVVGRWAEDAAIDPEEMLVAALSGCHMLFFLQLAREAGFVVAGYHDRAEGTMSDVEPGRQAVTNVMLQPRIDWIGPAPTASELAGLHHRAHEACFIANSVKTRVSWE